MNNNPLLLIIPSLLFILGILEIIFSDKFASLYKKLNKYIQSPFAKPRPESYYTSGLVRGIGVGIIIFSTLMALIIIVG